MFASSSFLNVSDDSLRFSHDVCVKVENVPLNLPAKKRHVTVTKSNWDENRNFQYLYMRPVQLNHKSFHFFPLPAIFSFFTNAFVSMHCSEVKSTAKTTLKCICGDIHPAPNSSRSEDSLFGPASGMTSERSEQFFHVNSYYE